MIIKLEAGKSLDESFGPRDPTEIKLEMQDDDMPLAQIIDVPASAKFTYQYAHPFIALAYQNSKVITIAYLTDRDQPIRIIHFTGIFENFVDL